MEGGFRYWVLGARVGCVSLGQLSVVSYQLSAISCQRRYSLIREIASFLAMTVWGAGILVKERLKALRIEYLRGSGGVGGDMGLWGIRIGSFSPGHYIGSADAIGWGFCWDLLSSLWLA